MAKPDLNLLFTLEALLAEGNVTRAARRLRLSPSAMSRSLARLRETTGDPLLVRAGRGLVPSPRALLLRDQVAQIVQDAEAALRPARQLNLQRLERLVTLRSSEGFVETFGPALIARVADEAPRVRLRFMLKADTDSAALRDGAADLETGVVGKSTGPELRAQALFRDRFIAVVRPGHPLSGGPPSAADFAAGRHVGVMHKGRDQGPVDQALAAIGLQRQVVVLVDGFAAALALVRASDLIACVPETHTQALRTGLHSFALPVALPAITVSMLWHPRLDGDLAHRWLREGVRAVCTAAALVPLQDEGPEAP